MATTALLYSSPTTITLSTASVGSSADFTAGRESTQIDNTSNLYEDVQVSGKVTVGTTPTTNTQIRVYVWGADTSLATTAVDVFDGTDSAETATNAEILASFMKLAHVIDIVSTTSNVTYPIGTFSLAQIFGSVPRFWGLFVSHNTGAALNATGGNHAYSYVGVKRTVA